MNSHKKTEKIMKVIADLEPQGWNYIKDQVWQEIFDIVEGK